jgi:hypothetical protein
MMYFEAWLESQYDVIRYEYEQELIENWYSQSTASNTDDWWIEFCKKEYEIYLSNNK